MNKPAPDAEDPIPNPSTWKIWLRSHALCLTVLRYLNVTSVVWWCTGHKIRWRLCYVSVRSLHTICFSQGINSPLCNMQFSHIYEILRHVPSHFISRLVNKILSALWLSPTGSRPLNPSASYWDCTFTLLTGQPLFLCRDNISRRRWCKDVWHSRTNTVTSRCENWSILHHRDGIVIVVLPNSPRRVIFCHAAIWAESNEDLWL